MELLVEDGKGTVLGVTGPITVAEPWWQAVDPFVDAVPDTVVLRLLRAEPEPDEPMDGRVTYLIENHRLATHPNCFVRGPEDSNRSRTGRAGSAGRSAGARAGCHRRAAGVPDLRTDRLVDELTDLIDRLAPDDPVPDPGGRYRCVRAEIPAEVAPSRLDADPGRADRP